jgi:hypothetical protein
MSALHDNLSSDSFSGTRSGSQDARAGAAEAELDENDGVTSADEEDEEDDGSDEEDDESESDHTDDASIASYDSDFPDEYIIHDHETRRNGKYSAIHCFQRA